MEDSIFDQPFVDEKYGTYLRNIEGVIEHSYLSFRADFTDQENDNARHNIKYFKVSQSTIPYLLNTF